MCDKVTIVLLHLLLLQSLGLVFLINRWRLIIFLFTEKQIITLMGSIKAQNPPFTLHSSLYCSTQLWEEALRALKVRIFKKLNRVNMTALQTTCTFPKHYTKVPTHKFTILPSYSLSSLFFSFALSLIQNTVNRTCTCTGKLVLCVRWFATGVKPLKWQSREKSDRVVSTNYVPD